MKKYIYSFLVFATTISFTGCNDDFLQRDPISTQTLVSLKSYDNFKTYGWGIYSNCFLGSTITDKLGVLNFNYERTSPYGRNGDDGLFASSGNPSWAWQTVTKTTGGGWDFSVIRQANIMMDNLDNSTMNDSDKKHWRAVGYFFRAYKYCQLIMNYGDVPWVEHALKETDIDIIYGPRTPRDQVAQNILDNLLWAEQNIKPEGEGTSTNSINVHVVRALISRFGLYEGTWRKYHHLKDADKYLDASTVASAKLLQSFPNISSEYDALYNSESLAGKPGILLYLAFGVDQIYHNFSRYERTSSANTEMSKECVASYLTTNGLPVANVANQVAAGGQYYGDSNMYYEFRNRDRRLYHTVTPPFRVNGLTNSTTINASYLKTTDTYGAANKPITAADSAMFVENIEIMKTLASKARTTGYQYPAGITYTSLLPTRNWEGNGLLAVPHLSAYSEGRGFLITRGGYYMYKYYNTSVNPTAQTSTNDIPIFRIEEVMLNYAEAMWEKGQFTQSIADMTINKLRDRAGVAHMIVANIGSDFDPNRDKGGYSDSNDPSGIADYEVNPVLWEIRRERRVELMGDMIPVQDRNEGFRFFDLKRWRKGHYMNKIQLGVTIDNADYKNSLAIWPYDINQGSKTANSNGKVGPIVLAGDPVAAGKGWKWYYYLYPISPTQLTLNPQLVQNPGWDKD